MKIRHTDDPDVCFMASDPVTLWTAGIVEYPVDRRGKKFLVTPVMRDVYGIICHTISISNDLRGCQCPPEMSC
jgi:hypothetical protein